MSKIINHWELRDFCYTHGRVIPHITSNDGAFTRFHCADKSHDDSETIICSEGIGTCYSTLVGILSMHGIVVEFDDRDEYLLCTESEFIDLNAISEQEKEREKAINMSNSSTKATDENPARPNGVKITREIHDISYNSYRKCTEFSIRYMTAKSRGYLTPPYILGDYSYTELICNDDCIFPNCPFYCRTLFDELRHNHRSDYDEWVVKYGKKRRGLE